MGIEKVLASFGRVSYLEPVEPTSTAWRLADTVSGGKLRSALLAARAEGLSYQAIADRLEAEHGVLVSRVTVRNWLVQLAEDPAA